MPSDVSLQGASLPQAATARRLPIGLGLGIGAVASLALWSAIGFGLKALFF